MNTRKLGWTDLQLTTLGLGTWAMGGGGWQFAWGPQNDEESIRTIRRALELGLNWIDTAPAYGLGHCEEVIGRALHEISPKPIVATKCGRSWNEQGQLSPNLKKQVIRAEVEASLKRLRIAAIDLYQIHWPQPDPDIEEAWSTIADIVKEGKVRYAGVSNFNVAQLERILPIHPVASLQPPYSMLSRGVEEALLDFCGTHRIGVLAYSPMQKGLLTGKITREWVQQLAPDDHRRRDPQFQEPCLGANLELVEGLRHVANQHGRSISQLAIAWVLRRTEMTAAIVGARKPSQIEETVAGGDWLIPNEDLEKIEHLLQKRQAAVTLR